MALSILKIISIQLTKGGPPIPVLFGVSRVTTDQSLN